MKIKIIKVKNKKLKNYGFLTDLYPGHLMAQKLCLMKFIKELIIEDAKLLN